MNWMIFPLLCWAFLSSGTLPQPRTAGVVKWTNGTDHDFGLLTQGSTARFAFQFQNALREPIVLQTVRTSCGCTAAEWTEAPIDPGKSGEVAIEFAAERPGNFRKKITVFFDKQRKAETLWIRGEVDSDE